MAINAGDNVKGKLSARFFNRGEQVFDWYDRNKARGEGAIPQATPIDHGIALIQNNTGGDLRRGEVVEFNGSLLSQPDPRVLSFSGVIPDLTHVGWGITLQQIPSGSMNDVLCNGICLAFVDFSDEDHRYADVSSGQVVLQSASIGPARILAKLAAGMGEIECIVQIRDDRSSLSLVRFELTGTLAIGSNAPAKLLQPTNIGTGKWEDTDPVTPIHVFDPYEPEGMWNGPSGCQGWAYPREQTNALPEPGVPAFDILWMERPAQILRGTSSIHMGQSTDWQIEVVVDWYDWQGIAPSSTVTVHDPMHSWQDVPSGSEVLAYYNNKESRYEVLNAQRVFLYARAVLGGPLCGETSMVSISDFQGLKSGEFIMPPDTLPTNAVNPRKHAGLSGDGITIRRANNDMPNPVWEIVDVDLHVVQPIVGLRLDGLKYQSRTRDIYAEICTTEPNEWDTWLEGDDECPDEA